MAVFLPLSTATVGALTKNNTESPQNTPNSGT